ncbi:nuclear transport factor 2 family protein, partial [Paraburkholderia sp. SIMBA_050]
MPRFARLFEAAADTLNAYYQAVADANLDALLGLWIDEDFASCVWADGEHLH